MIDVRQDTLLALSDVCRRFPGRAGGKPLHYETVRLWALTGRRGVVLETLIVGGRRYTSEEALERFIAALNASADRPAPRRPRSKRADMKQALRERFGIGRNRP